MDLILGGQFQPAWARRESVREMHRVIPGALFVEFLFLYSEDSDKRNSSQNSMSKRTRV